MVDLVERLYVPLYNYHMAHGDGGMVDTAKSAAKATADAAALGREIVLNRPTLNGLMDRLGNNPQAQSSQALDAALIQRWKQDPQILEKLDRDLKNNPALAQRLEKAIIANPNSIAAALPKYTGGNLADVLPAQPAPVAPAARRPDPAAPAAEPPAARTPAGRPHRPAPAEPAAAAVPPAPAAAAPAATPVLSPEDRAKIQMGVFHGFATADDVQISKAIKPDMVVAIAKGMAEQSVSKFGVDGVAAKAFADTIERDKGLQQRIAENFRQNPDFVRQLAKASQDTSTPSDGTKTLAKKMMEDVLANPEKLADKEYVSDLSSKMKMGNSLNTAGSFLDKLGLNGSGIMGGLAGMFQGVIDWVKNLINEFTGGNFMSMRNSGRGFFDAFSHSLNSASANMGNAAQVESKLTVQPMRGPDGKPTYRHDEFHTDAEGNQVRRSVPNTIEVDTMGMKVRVVPTTGSPITNDGTGYKLWLAKDVDANGKPKDLIQVTMTDGQLATYNANLKQYGLDPTNPPQMYYGPMNMRDVSRAPTTVVQIDSKTGAMSPPAELATQPVRKVGDPARTASNDPSADGPRLQA